VTRKQRNRKEKRKNRKEVESISFPFPLSLTLPPLTISPRSFILLNHSKSNFLLFFFLIIPLFFDPPPPTNFIYTISFLLKVPLKQFGAILRYINTCTVLYCTGIDRGQIGCLHVRPALHVPQAVPLCSDGPCAVLAGE
jgi:hypothetical protein